MIKKLSIASIALFAVIVQYSLADAGTCWEDGGCDSSGTSPWSVKASDGGADSAEYSDVNCCVTVAAAEDTINVPAGSATWSSTLNITKGINLIGAGSDVAGTVITNSGGSDRVLISYDPSDAADDYDYTFRVSGFRFLMGGAGHVFQLDCLRESSSVAQTQIRIDNNYAENTSSYDHDSGGFIGLWDCWGVADSNELVNVRSPFRFWGDDYGSEKTWDRYPSGMTLGSQDNFYIEDNDISGIDNTYMVIDNFEQGRWAIRYNTIEVTDARDDWGNIFDLHPTCFGLEMYGNRIIANSVDENLMSQRGGKGVIFYNAVTGSTPSWGGYLYNNDGSYALSNMEHNNIYFLNNRNGLTSNLMDVSEGTDDVNTVTINSTYWKDNTSESGSSQTSGIRCGSDRTVVTTCTEGVAFWETNSSCSDLTNLTGDINTYPSRLTIDGTLYKCGSSNDWTPYFTPLEYPHPLRNESPTPAAVLTGSLSDDATEAEIVNGGETVIITLANDTWVATIGENNDITTNFIAGIDSNQDFDNFDWDSIVKGGLTYQNITRNDGTTVTVLLPAFNTYDIDSNETITITIPADSLTAGEVVVASPSFSIAAQGAAESTTYWVSTTGNPATTWASCKGDSDPSVYCYMGTANSNAVAGDTINVKSGTYNTDGGSIGAGSANDENIDPANSGSSGNPITYTAIDGNHTVTITGPACNGTGEPAIDLRDGNNYITVNGLDAYGCAHFIMISGGSNNIITNGSFDRDNLADWHSSRLDEGSQYNWIHDNQFSKAGECTGGGSDDGSILDIGDEEDSSDTTAYNLVEDNVFFHAGHHILGLMSQHNTIRNNYFHNEVWTNGKGNRTLYIAGYNTNVKENLIEGNRFGYAAPPCDASDVGGVAVAASYNIFRYNMFYHHDIHGLYFQVYAGYSDSSYNHVYNNTFFNNCNSTVWPSLCDEGFEDSAIGFIDWEGSEEVKYNVFKNNLYFNHFTPYTENTDAYIADQTFANEFNGDVSGDPLFIDASTTYPADKTDSSLPDLSIPTNSPAKDVGGALTTVSSGCNSAALTLADADYFQDGTWGPSDTIDADWIAVGTVGNTVQISSISGNVVTMVSSVSCTNSDSVWLYKDSDGTVVLYGSAPDAGAYEYQ